MSLLFPGGKAYLKGLRKVPKTVLIIDSYRTITENDKRKMRDIGKGMEIDFEERRTHYSLIILCNVALRFSLVNPLSLAEGEIWFTRNEFSKETFVDALNYYSTCEIRNGV